MPGLLYNYFGGLTPPKGEEEVDSESKYHFGISAGFRLLETANDTCRDPAMARHPERNVRLYINDIDILKSLASSESGDAEIVLINHCVQATHVEKIPVESINLELHNAHTSPPTQMPRRETRHTTQRIHHRFVADFTRKPLDTFSCSKQMMQAIFDAFTGHRQAYEKCNIIHRDVSGRHILLDENGRGTLTDWDLANGKEHIEWEGGEHNRTGTWEFMSTLTLGYPSRIYTIQDDIESFVHVVLYHGLRYLKHNATADLSIIFNYVFQQKVVFPDGQRFGGDGKAVMFARRKYIHVDFGFTLATPLTAWINNVFPMVAQYLDYKAPTPPARTLKARKLKTVIPTLAIEDLELSTHEMVAFAFEECLEDKDWPRNDKAVDAFKKIGRISKAR